MLVVKCSHFIGEHDPDLDIGIIHIMALLPFRAYDFSPIFLPGFDDTAILCPHKFDDIAPFKWVWNLIKYMGKAAVFLLVKGNFTAPKG